MEHKFNVELAKLYGVEEAIIIDNIYYWIAKNAANEKHKHDGRYWTYNSAKAFSELFPYMNEKKIYRVFKNLIDGDFLICGNFSDNKYDRTKWYSFSDTAIEILREQKYDTNGFTDDGQNVQMHFPKTGNGIPENGKCITNINTNIINKEGDTNVSPKKKPLDYQLIVDCWNEHNGKKCGKITRITDKRKSAIRKILSEHDITQEELMRLFATLPYADSWLYNPTKEHKNWKPDFDWWMANTNGWFTKALEGKVHTQNTAVFNTIMQNGEGNVYAPCCGGALNWNDYYNCYIYTSMFVEHLDDGYTKSDRPDGATIMLNNGRGYIVWNKEKGQWVNKK